MPWMFVGGTYVLHESFNAERVIEDIARHKVTHIIMVPAQITAILDSPATRPEKLMSLEMLHNLGAPLHVRFKERINARAAGPVLRALWPDRRLHDRPRQARLGPQAGLRRLSAAVHGDPHPARGRQRVRSGRGRRDLRPEPVHDARLLQAPRPDGEERSSTAGCTPATPATSTRTATCSSSIASRT